MKLKVHAKKEMKQGKYTPRKKSVNSLRNPRKEGPYANPIDKV